MPRKYLLFILMVFMIIPACSQRSGGSTLVVKPKPYHRFYDRKKDKRKKRTKLVRMKS